MSLRGRPPADAGYSLVLIGPETRPDVSLPTQWRRSIEIGGNPGTTDALPLPPNPAGDANGNGEPDLIDYALGNDGQRPTRTLQLEYLGEQDPGLSRFRLSYPLSVGADRAAIAIVYSRDLEVWQDATSLLTPLQNDSLDPGRVLVTWRLDPPTGAPSPLFLRLQARAR
jgi:hypothetical protein